MLRVIYAVWEIASLPFLTLFKPPRIGAACLIVDQAGGVLLVRQTYRKGWHLPGGGVKWGECVEDGAKREAWEETGVVVDGPLELWGAYTYLNPRYTDHVVIYLARHWHRVERSSFEIAETRFFDLDDLPPDLGAGVRRRLDELAGRVPKSLSWTGETPEAA